MANKHSNRLKRIAIAFDPPANDIHKTYIGDALAAADALDRAIEYLRKDHLSLNHASELARTGICDVCDFISEVESDE